MSYASTIRRYSIVHRATLNGAEYWAADRAVANLDRGTNVAGLATMGRAVAAMIAPRGAKRAGGTLHGAPFGRGVSQSQTVKDTALALAWRAHRSGTSIYTTAELARRTRDLIHVAGAYKPTTSTVAARIGEDVTRDGGYFTRDAHGITISGPGFMRLTRMRSL